VRDKGPGAHILTGPVAIEEAEPGDVLEIQILKIDIDVPFACNSFGPGRGFLPNDFPYGRTKVIPLDVTHMGGKFGAGINIPLHPFFGSMGIAPEGMERISSGPPWIHAGNMDNKELVAGTFGAGPQQVLIFVDDEPESSGEPGFHSCDIHFAVALSGVPVAGPPAAYISMGFDEDLKTATEMAVRNMIDFLVTEKHLSRDDAYALTSVAVDVDITQLVDGRVGVHAICPKAIFER
jgi:acetamidase/formamidase